MEYQDIKPVSKQAAEIAFESQQTEAVCNALVAIAFYEQDWKWVQDKCLYFLKDKDSTVSGLAATCLGHIARIHQQIEREKVISALREHLDSIEIEGRIEDALDDIDMFTLR